MYGDGAPSNSKLADWNRSRETGPTSTEVLQDTVDCDADGRGDSDAP